MGKQKIQTVIFDMDGTIAFRDTYNASYRSFFRHMGLEKEVLEINEKYQNKELNIMTPENHQCQFRETAALLNGKKAPLPREVFPVIPYAPGFQQFCHYLRSHEINAGIVTLSLLYAADLIREENDMQLAYANEIHILNGCFTGMGTLHVMYGSKGTMVQRAVQALGSTPEKTAYIGDSLNDVDPWNSVALPLGVNLHHPDCGKSVNGSFTDFTRILDYFKTYVKLEKRTE